MAPNSFASAAAGNNGTPTRAEGGGDWSRRVNGATQTFRRPSATPVSSNSLQRDPTVTTPGAGVYIPPHLNPSRSGALIETRYSKEQLLQLFRSQRQSNQGEDLHALFVAGWAPYVLNGTTTPGWGRRDDHVKDNATSADVCWEKDGSLEPLGLTEPSEEEKELFIASVNSPLKPPQQNPKEGTTKEGLSLRKSSISQGQNGPGMYGLASPTSARPGTRRRETSDSFPFPNSLVSPTASRFNREEPNTTTPPQALLRRKTDYKEPQSAASEDRDKEKQRDASADTPGPFGSLKRSSTQPFSAGIAGPSSPWSAGPQTAGYTPMGSFGNFAIGAASAHSGTPTEKRPPLSGLRGESRFKGLMSKDSSEDVGKSVREKSSFASLGRVNETDQGRQTPSWMESRANRPQSNDTDPYSNDDFRTGSAALQGEDASPPRNRGLPPFDTPDKHVSRDDGGLSAFGMTSDAHHFQNLLRNNHQFGQQTPNHRSGAGDHEPMSPTDTNPYQSPDQERHDDDIDTDGSDIHNAHLPGLGGYGMDTSQTSGFGGFGGLAGLGRLPPAYETAASDRSQTSSAGPGRGFPNVGTLGALPGLGGPSPWSQAPESSSTPMRERPAPPLGLGYGGGMFGSNAETQSPALAGLGPGGLFSPSTGTVGRGSKLGSLFPAAMQEQMRSVDDKLIGDDEINERQTQAPNFGRYNAGALRDTESPFRQNRGIFDDLIGTPGGGNRSVDTTSGLGNLFSSAPLQTPSLATAGQDGSGQRSGQPPAVPTQSVNTAASNQPPPAQLRTMVMPDRMRWMYRDPQGQTQGPWTGLEMHDWYKAGFFNPELLVKKYEDPDYEPLAQLIRRIGNSREPFLVPQIGIPHGPPANPAGTPWTGTGGPSAVGGVVQPPFPNSFPTFGTTLTAEQQNALERRKQEEQYLMARQKEHLAQQQILAKQMQSIGGHGMHQQQLHHHSSAHSLHSQPSFGSMTSPNIFQPSPNQGPMHGSNAPGFFDNSFRPGALGGLGSLTGSLDQIGNIREEELPGLLDRLNLGRGGQNPFGTAPGSFGQSQPQDPVHASNIQALLNQKLQLEREQADEDAATGMSMDETANLDRLHQFHDLQAQYDQGDDQLLSEGGSHNIGEEHGFAEHSQFEHASAKSEAEASPAMSDVQLVKPEELSLTEQVQKTQSAKQTPATQSPWAKVDTNMPLPFPPPQSSSPLPAPAAQRTRSNVAEALAAESRSRPETPAAETPSASIAPWAKETVEVPKGPSLREIQEAEAKKAAQLEQLAAAQRRAQLERERELLAQVEAAVPQPGLPSTSTWASTTSPSTTTPTTPSAWAKPLAGKAVPTSSKTLSQIQKEEEARKQKQAQQAAKLVSAANTALIPQTSSSGKRYADLASKTAPAQPPSAAVGGAWTTVGASGKVKAPATPTPTGPAGGRSVSSTVLPGAAIKPKAPAAPTRSVTSGSPLTGQANAHEEFKKWAVNELRGDLNKGISLEDTFSLLMNLPLEMDLVTETVHSVSQTMDSRHFAEEFIRRRKLADKGVVDPATTQTYAAEKQSGGWSEVAKKGPATSAPKEEPNNFRVVAAKKKGAKR